MKKLGLEFPCPKLSFDVPLLCVAENLGKTIL